MCWRLQEMVPILYTPTVSMHGVISYHVHKSPDLLLLGNLGW